MAERKATRRQVLKAAGVAAGVAASPWWLVKTSHAQRAKKIVFWHVPNFTPLADELQKQQVYEFAKQAGVKDSEVEYATVANEQFDAKLAAALEAGNPPDVTRLYESNVQYYAAGATSWTSTTSWRRCAGSPRASSSRPWPRSSTRGAPWGCRWP